MENKGERGAFIIAMVGGMLVAALLAIAMHASGATLDRDESRECIPGTTTIGGTLVWNGKPSPVGTCQTAPEAATLCLRAIKASHQAAKAFMNHGQIRTQGDPAFAFFVWEQDRALESAARAALSKVDEVCGKDWKD